jgi:putative hydrolases of HD superfamily
VPDHTDRDATAIASFAFELGVLKRMRRAGWWHVGVRDPESVAEHSLRVAQLASLLAALEGADPARAAFLAIWHDSQETRTGDIPHTARPYLQLAPNETITADQTARLPDAVRKSVQEAVMEYEEQATAEAHCARDADKLDAWYRQWSTARPATTVFKAGSIARAVRFGPTRRVGSPRLHSPCRRCPGGSGRRAPTGWL